MQKQNFKNRVINIVKKIPKGSVLSYKQVASLAGSPMASRAVGNIMKNNKDKDVPCHRVIKSDGSVGGYNGLKGEKARLLIKEGYKLKNS